MSIQTDIFTEQRIIDAAPISHNEEAIERALRPKQLDEYVGQEKIRDQLEIFITAARQRKEALDHTLLFGPPGLARRRWRTSSRAKWASICARPPAPCWSARAIWRRF